MKRKKLTVFLLYVIIGICFIPFLIGNKTNATEIYQDLEKLARTFEQKDGTIIEWSLYAREPVYLSTNEEWLSKRQYLEDTFPNMEWTVSSNSITGHIDHGLFSETIQLLSDFDKNRQIPSYITYEVKGIEGDSLLEKNILSKANTTIAYLFDEKPTIFSCIKGEFNEELDELKSNSFNGLLHSLQADVIESVEEREFYSISAYSSLFAQSLSFTNKRMNMQIGLRKNEMGEGTIVVVGTPILTIEY